MKEFMWEIEGYSGTIYAKNYIEAKEKIVSELSIQEVDNNE
jgi:hypothetical protein